MTTDALEDRARRAKARVGTVLKEKWTIDSLLGVGGMAVVYGATHRNNGKRVAVKMLHTELSVVAQIKQRFLREGYASNHVGHPGVVSVLDDDVSEDGAVFLVMELLEGENLEQRRTAAGGKLDLLEVLWAVDQLLDVLVAAHAKGVIHRDIKPENIFLTNQAALKVLDFGLARVQRPQTKGLTRTNMLMGTLDFMPPEQARGQWEGVGPQADLWSVGATMFMLLSGHPVHEEPTVDTQLRAVTTRPARSLRSVCPDLPEPVIALVDRALAFTPKDRWPDALSMQEAVREAYIRVGGGDNAPTTIRPSLADILPRPPQVNVEIVNAPPPVVPSSAPSESDLARTRALEPASYVAFVEDEATHAIPSAADPPTVPPPRLGSKPDLGPRLPLPPRVPSDPALAPTEAPPPVAPLMDPEAPTTSAPLKISGAFPAAPPVPASPASPAPLAAPAPAAPEPFPKTLAEVGPWLERRKVVLVLVSLPLWLLLFWVVTSLRSCGQEPASTTPGASGQPTSSAPDPGTLFPSPPVDSAAPAGSADPAASASAAASAKKPTRPPIRPPIRKKK